MVTCNDDQILSGIQAVNQKLVASVYSDCFNSIKFMVCNNHGSIDEAQDVFHDALLIILHQGKDPTFSLTCSFRTYLYAIGRNLWIRNLLYKGKWVSINSAKFQNTLLTCKECYAFEVCIIEEQMYMYQRHFASLTKQSQMVIKMMLGKYTTEEIMKAMRFSSMAYTRKRKHQCKQALIRRIQSDPDYPRLLRNFSDL
ncbi:MAG: sigma-70 family RNA polymerase sigma factor [Bacteroidia bacterium]|nr:sigma-70 family RNA polymerase sigma factor [Bacteroidia bacterium]